MTLVEMLVVVSIVSMATVIARPAFVKFGQTQALGAEIREMSRILQFARSEAIATRRYVAVELDLAAYPTADGVRILGNAEYLEGISRWDGTEVFGIDSFTVAAPFDIEELRVGTTVYATGLHYVVFSPAGQCRVDDGSIPGSVEVDIAQIDAV